MPTEVAIDGQSGAVLIVDYGHHVIRVVHEEGDVPIIRTAAGTGTCDFEGDEGPSTSAALCSPTGVAVDGEGGLYIADRGNNRIRYAHFPR